LTRLAILDCPHPVILRRHLWHNPAQRRRSWYFFYFQLPWLPERKLRRDGYRAIRSIFAKTSRPGTFSAEDLDRYVAAAAQPGALTAMLSWYRAAFRYPPRRLRSPRVDAPTLILWGTRDMALGREMVAPSAALCREVAVTYFEESGHWLPHEEPERVNELLLAHLGARAPGV
jgi:pimeloyl-ACP methyl ester carboxylesterase